MKVHVLQHVPFEGIGSIVDWLTKRDATVGYTRFYESAELPDPGQCNLVIAMGGPMRVNDEQAYPWIEQEKAFLRETIRLGQPVVGICLGAQLIASALGASVCLNITIIQIQNQCVKHISEMLHHVLKIYCFRCLIFVKMTHVF